MIVTLVLVKIYWKFKSVVYVQIKKGCLFCLKYVHDALAWVAHSDYYKKPVQFDQL